MPLLPEGQTKGSWEPSKISALAEIGEHLGRKVFITGRLSVLLCIQENAEIVHEIPSCCCTLLIQSSRLKFIKIKSHDLTLKITKLNFQAKDMQRLDGYATILSLRTLPILFKVNLHLGRENKEKHNQYYVT